MSLVADLCYLLAGLLYLPRLIYDWTVLGKNRRGWGERFGGLRELPAHRRRVWIHAVSVGEMNATRTLVDRLRAAYPDAEIIISTTTDTGYARGRTLYPDLYVFRYPLDFSWVVRRALRRLKPTLIVLVELEVWHNLLALAARRNVPVAVFNGRLSERSVRRFGLVKPLIRRMFRRLAWVGAQDEAYGERFIGLGTPVDRVIVTGSVKFDTAPAEPQVSGADELAADMGIAADRPLLVCGSTGPGEEQYVLDAYREVLTQQPTLQLAVIPRKPERFDEVARLIVQKGFACVRRSSCDGSSPAGAEAGGAAMANGTGASTPAVLLGDTMGELRKFYSLAAVVFVGRSLVPMGGSDVIEAAALAKPMLVGPHTGNFADAIRRLREREALIETNPQRLAADVSAVINDPALAERMGRSAHEVVQANRGATERAIDSLRPFLS